MDFDQTIDTMAASAILATSGLAVIRRTEKVHISGTCLIVP